MGWPSAPTGFNSHSYCSQHSDTGLSQINTPHWLVWIGSDIHNMFSLTTYTNPHRNKDAISIWPKPSTGISLRVLKYKFNSTKSEEKKNNYIFPVLQWHQQSLFPSKCQQPPFFLIPVIKLGLEDSYEEFLPQFCAQLLTSGCVLQSLFHPLTPLMLFSHDNQPASPPRCGRIVQSLQESKPPFGTHAHSLSISSHTYTLNQACNVLPFQGAHGQMQYEKFCQFC